MCIYDNVFSLKKKKKDSTESNAVIQTLESEDFKYGYLEQQNRKKTILCILQDNTQYIYRRRK